MLKCDIKTNSHSLCETNGTLPDLLGETLTAIKMVYNAIADIDERGAELFRGCLLSSLVDPNNPVWFRDERPISAMFKVEKSDSGVLQ